MRDFNSSQRKTNRLSMSMRQNITAYMYQQRQRGTRSCGNQSKSTQSVEESMKHGIERIM